MGRRRRFNITGLCIPGEHYMVDISPKIDQIISQYIENREYFTVNRARQYGKTTLLELLYQRLKGEYIVIDISFEGKEDYFKTLNTLAEGLVFEFQKVLKRAGYPALAQIFQQPVKESLPIQDLGERITILCERSEKKVILMADEVDKAADNQVFLTFLGLLRDKFMMYRKGREASFDSVILAGVHDIKNLKIKIRPEAETSYNSPWNISADFSMDLSFSPREIGTMLWQYENDCHTGMEIPLISELLYMYTEGYPFLVSGLCKLMDENLLPWTEEGVRSAVKSLLSRTNTLFDDIIKNLERHKGFRDMVEVILLQGADVSYIGSNPDIARGEMYGIIKNESGYVKISNQIFESYIYEYLVSIHVPMAEDTLFSGESINVEYKVEVPSKSEKYMKTVVAYANGRGGRIVFGIDDTSLEVVGMNPDTIFQTMDAITNAVSDSCEPKIYPDVALQAIDDKTVIVMEIHPGPMRPYYIKKQGLVDGTYVRVSGTSRHAEGYMLKELILEGQNRYFDSEPCQGLKVTDEDIEKLCQELKEAALKNTWNDSEKAVIRDVTKNVLLTWGVLREENGEILPTNAYALLTGQMRMQPVIQCAVFKGVHRAYFVDRREYDGPIQNQVDAAFQYVLEKINMGMQIKGIYRQDVYELPVDSVRELIANAAAHRSYLEPGNIQVAILDDRLEITSPGMLLNTVSLKKMAEGYSKLRNPAIASAFAYMKIIEKWGTGIPKVLRECKEYGLPEPELIDFDGDFRVNMYRKTQISEIQETTQTTTQTTQTTTQTTQTTTQTALKTPSLELTDNDRAILKVIQYNPKLTQREIALELNWSVDRVKYYLNKMKKQAVIKRVGSSHNGHWEMLVETEKGPK